MGLILIILPFYLAVRLLMNSSDPKVCSAVYTTALLILRLAFGANFIPALITAAITFLIYWAYFELLRRTIDSKFWWLLVVVGALLSAL